MRILWKSIKCYTDDFKTKKLFFHTPLDSINFLQKFFEHFGHKFKIFEIFLEGVKWIQKCKKKYWFVFKVICVTFYWFSKYSHRVYFFWDFLFLLLKQAAQKVLINYTFCKRVFYNMPLSKYLCAAFPPTVLTKKTGQYEENKTPSKICKTVANK